MTRAAADARQTWSVEHGMVVRRYGTGPELVWIHGLGEQSSSFDAITSRIAGVTHVLPDLPGYGRTPWGALAARANGPLAEVADARDSRADARDPLTALADARASQAEARGSLTDARDSRGSLTDARDPLTALADARGSLTDARDSRGSLTDARDSLTGLADARGALAALAEHLVAWLRDRPPVILAGHSMGGVLATLVAEQLPVRALVNIEGNLTRGDCTFSAEAAKFSLADFRAHGFAAMRDAVYARGAREPALRGYHAALLAANADVFHAHATDLVRVSSVNDLVKRFAALRVPSLYIAGNDGICITSRGALDSIGAPWIDLDPAGHWPFIDQPEAFATAVAGVIARI